LDNPIVQQKALALTYDLIHLEDFQGCIILGFAVCAWLIFRGIVTVIFFRFTYPVIVAGGWFNLIAFALGLNVLQTQKNEGSDE